MLPSQGQQWSSIYKYYARRNLLAIGIYRAPPKFYDEEDEDSADANMLPYVYSGRSYS